jgi:hypothetical protein
VSAEDPDCGVNADVNYTIGEGFRRFREFEIRPVSGDICISGRLDHETRSVYEFPVVATDRGDVFVVHLSYHIYRFWEPFYIPFMFFVNNFDREFKI